MQKLTLEPIIAAVVLSVTAILGNQAEEALERMRTAWNTTQTYQVQMAIHQGKGSKTEDRIISFNYMSPGWIRTDILEGKNKGGVAIYDPYKDKVRVKQPAIPIPLTFSPDAAVVKTLRGHRIYEGSFGGLLKKADWYLAKGVLTWIGEETFEGKTCAVIEFTTSSPDKNRGIARERWWLDVETNFPKKAVGYEESGKKVSWVIFRNLKLNPEFSSDLFEL